MTNLSIAWLRRDLRLHDHAVLHHALATPGTVQPVFIFDTDILSDFPNPQDRRVTFLMQALQHLHQQLTALGGGMLVLHGRAETAIPKLHTVLKPAQIIAVEDYEPSARARDAAVKNAVGAEQFTLVCDHVGQPPYQVLKPDGTPYRVFTPFARQWRVQATPATYGEYAVDLRGRLADYTWVCAAATRAGLYVLDMNADTAVLLEKIGYQPVDMGEWNVTDARERLENFITAKVKKYPAARDFMATPGTSKLSPYLRFGLVSVRECLRAAMAQGNADAWVNELIWRDFYAAILYHFPLSATQEFQEVYRGKLTWRQDQEIFARFTAGQTGYPVVDAAMRELLQTGWMHNRARMMVASFLTKDLHMDWRLGDAHFAQYLMDYDMASNVGGWQWAASTGTDAQPYFRVFNPVLQSEKFDPAGDYIRRFVPEIAHLSDAEIHAPWLSKNPPASYPGPIVDHRTAKEHAISMFKQAQAS